MQPVTAQPRTPLSQIITSMDTPSGGGTSAAAGASGSGSGGNAQQQEPAGKGGGAGTAAASNNAGASGERPAAAAAAEGRFITLVASTRLQQLPGRPSTFRIRIPKLDAYFTGTGGRGRITGSWWLAGCEGRAGRNCAEAARGDTGRRMDRGRLQARIMVQPCHSSGTCASVFSLASRNP